MWIGRWPGRKDERGCARISTDLFKIKSHKDEAHGGRRDSVPGHKVHHAQKRNQGGGLQVKYCLEGGRRGN